MKKNILIVLLCCVAIICVIGGLFLLREKQPAENPAAAHYGQTTETATPEASQNPAESGNIPASPAETDAPAQKPEGNETAPETDGANSRLAAAAVDSCIAKLEDLQSQFVGALQRVEAEAKAEYSALSEAERTAEKRNEIANAKISEAGELEAECDAAVNAALKELREALDALDADLSPVNELRKNYERQKIEKKSDYMVQMKNFQAE